MFVGQATFSHIAAFLESEGGMKKEHEKVIPQVGEWERMGKYGGRTEGKGKVMGRIGEKRKKGEKK